MIDGAWLDSFNDSFKPEHAFVRGIDSLADGGYDFEIVKAEDGFSANGKNVINLTLRVNGGATVQHTYWLDNQMNAFGADCATLGLNANHWGAGPGKIPLSVAIPKAMRELVGIKFRGVKSTNPSKDGLKVYHNLAISSRISGAPMPPPIPAPAPVTAASPAVSMYSQEEGNIPF